MPPILDAVSSLPAAGGFVFISPDTKPCVQKAVPLPPPIAAAYKAKSVEPEPPPP